MRSDGVQRGVVGSRDADLPIRQSTGSEAIGIWGRTQRCEDEERSLAEARSHRADRISWNGLRGRSRRQTPHVRRAQPEKSRISHPFHPLSGCEFEAVACKEYRGEQRVCSLDKKDRQCEIPLSWTDLAAEDPVRILDSGKSWFRAADLVESACSVGELRR